MKKKDIAGYTKLHQQKQIYITYDLKGFQGITKNALRGDIRFFPFGSGI